jgi:hypothetical protein
MAANKLAWVDIEAELAAEIEASLFLCLAATVCQENIRTMKC